MDLRNLTTFIQVAELSSFTRAAEKLGYSQPTVSFQIKQLESELGVQLFERVGHTVSLTADGREALSRAQLICRLSDEMIGAVAAETEAVVVRLAMADSLCGPLISDGFAAFHAAHPHIALQITAAGTDDMFRLLDHNEVDLVCTLDNHIYNTTYVISSEQKTAAHFVCAATHPLAKEKRVEVKALLNEPFLLTEKGMSYRRLLDERLAADSMEINPILELGSADVISRLVEAGVGLSFLPDYVTDTAVMEGRMARLHVDGFAIELWKQVLHHRDKWMSPQLIAVIEYLSGLTV